ncbi:kazrin isoform X2 [Bradysia coprophila]|uniref:kazrin isoform X2 n=1 Tax=Bradysia coprophila TaxID=38358 RepID=UPI00187D7583|nr:kazrin isoform X2 [Bradysia coprophila]
MQLNGSIVPTMAASEPPEPPPRNPDKINASLGKQITADAKTKSVDAPDRPVNNNKPIKSIISLDSTTSAAETTIELSTDHIDNSHNKKLAPSNIDSMNESTTTINKTTTAEYMNGDGGCSGSNLNRNENNVIPKDEGEVSHSAIEINNKYQLITIDKSNANNIQLNYSNSDDDFGSDRQLELSNKDDKMENVYGNRSDINSAKEHSFDSDSSQSMKLRLENERLTYEINRLKKLLQNSDDGAIGGVYLSDSNSADGHSTDDKSRIERLESELKKAKDQITNLRNERKRLKADKSDLLAHVKQLCASLQDKEQELRDFIRNFEHRIRETESTNAKVSSERERERWSLLKHAREESERSLALAAQLNARDIQLQRIQEQLQEARRQLSGCMSDQESLLSFAPLTPPSGMMSHMAGPSSSSGGAGERGSCSADSGVRGSSDRESATGDMNLSDGPCDNGPCITVDPDSISLVSSHHMYQYGTPKERSPTLSPLNVGTFSRSIDSGTLSRSVEHLQGSPIESECPPVTRRIQPKSSSGLGSRSGRGGTWGSISRVFARTRNRNKTQADTECSEFQWSPLTEEGYTEKLRLLREASALPIERWRASQVLAWLEVALGMPQYSSKCSENVKSGKVLLELNDGELETGLGLTHPMHRKKLRLAIEEQRRPDLIRYATIGQLGHTWVASEWLPDIGLMQYTETFLHSLVDARMLDTLSKKELEKFLNVTRKFHQASIVHGIHVLRILKYDRQTLAMRRLQCETVDADPIVWTNQRFIRWARSIDLGEYADNLKDSGVHGGLVVLEPSFSGETIATALGIPPSKNIIRRHLCTEFDALVLPARSQLGQGIRTGGSVVPITGPGGLQQQYHSMDRRSSGSLRGSLSKAFRFNSKYRPDKQFGTSTSPTPSYSSSENGIYATIGPPPLPTTAPPSHRVSAPPMDTQSGLSSMPRSQHRRVKSISDIDAIAATPV